MNNQQKSMLDKYSSSGLSKYGILLPFHDAINFFHEFNKLEILIDGFDNWRPFRTKSGERVYGQSPGDCFYISNELTDVVSTKKNQHEILEHLEYLKNNNPPDYVTFDFSDREINDYVRWKKIE